MENEKPIGKPYKKKNGAIAVSFTISDCPLWLYKWFITEEPERYNDIYWVRLKEIHDYIAMSSEPAPKVELTPNNPEMEKKSKDYIVRTFGGVEKVKMEEKEDE